MKIIKARNICPTTSKEPKGPQFEEITIDDNGTKVVEGEFHTLFISKQDRVLEEFQTEHGGDILTAVKEAVPEHKKYTLYIEQFGHNKNQLHKIMNELRQASEYDILELRIDSPGGYVSEGTMLFNTMSEVFNGRTITFLDSTGFSMGAVIFSLGDERIAYEDSSLMYHNYSTGYMGKGGEIKSYIDFEDKHFTDFFTDKIVNKGFMTTEEYNRMKDGKDFWMDSEEMAKRGICTAVVVGGYRLDNEAYLEYKAQEAPIDEWAVLKLKEAEAEVKAEQEAAQKIADAQLKRQEKIMKEAEKIIVAQEEAAQKKKDDAAKKKEEAAAKKKAAAAKKKGE